MLATSSPSSQKADFRPISFVLDDQTTGSLPVTVNLAIRPEDLTRSDPSRLNVQQTLGGAWGDNFGPGIPQITISGMTGWRRGAADGLDGMDRFTKLYEQVYSGWHKRRKAAIAAGKDPDKVQLVFADALDKFAVVVAPNNFVLRRSKSRPLMCQYQIALTVMDQNINQSAYLHFGGSQIDAAIKQSTGLDSLTDSIDSLTATIQSISSAIDRTLVAPVQSFMNQTARLYGSVRGAIAAGTGIAGQLISIAQMTARAGINIFRTFAAIQSIPTQAKALLMQVVGAYTNIWCVLRNALNQQIYYPDYSPLFGASNCSSTSGGRPISILSGQNPFYSVVPTRQPLPVQISQTAQNNLAVLASNDPVLSPMSTASLGSVLTQVTNGLAVAA